MDKLILKRILVSQKKDLHHSAQFVRRSINLAQQMNQPEITVVTGVRRAGKSSLLEQHFIQNNLLENVLYMNFEDPQTLDFQAQDFLTLYEIWLEMYGEKVQRVACFDEIQNVAGWERWMNFFAKQKKFKVFITGSNSNLLSSELGTHLTGRQITLAIFPLSFFEIVADQQDAPRLVGNIASKMTLEDQVAFQKLTKQYIEIGGFPRAWISQETSILQEYYSNILNRDIVRRKKLRNITAIDKLGLLLMSNVGRKINKSKVATLIGLKDGDTVEKYLTYFEECFLGYQVRKFSPSVRVQLRNQVKFYAIDTALANRVGITSDSKSTYYLENIVFIELLRRGGKIYYWQSNQAEIDFVVETNERERHLVQVCWDLSSSETEEREVNAFKEFARNNKGLVIHKKLIITLEGSERHISDIQVVPFYLWAIRSVEEN